MTNETKKVPVYVVSWPETIDLTVYPLNNKFPLADFDVVSGLNNGTADNCAPAQVVLNINLPFTERVGAALEVLLNDRAFLSAFFQTDKLIDFEINFARRIKIAEIFSNHGIHVSKNPNLDEIGFSDIKEFEQKLNGLEINELFSLMVEYNRLIEMEGRETSDAVWIERSHPSRANNFKTVAGANAYPFFKDLIDDLSGQFGIGHLIRYVYFHRTEFKNVNQPFSLSVLS